MILSQNTIMNVKIGFTESMPVTSTLSDLAEDDWDEIGMEHSEMLGNFGKYWEKA